jgi:predicted nucleic acid-binding Zn ribbon protein
VAATCLACGASLPTDASPLRKTCGTSCRVRLHYARKEARQAAALDLLLRQSRAVRDGDADVLASVAAEADALFGSGE